MFIAIVQRYLLISFEPDAFIICEIAHFGRVNTSRQTDISTIIMTHMYTYLYTIDILINSRASIIRTNWIYIAIYPYENVNLYLHT